MSLNTELIHDFFINFIPNLLSAVMCLLVALFIGHSTYDKGRIYIENPGRAFIYLLVLIWLIT